MIYPGQEFEMIDYEYFLQDENSKCIKRSVVPTSNKINEITEDIFEENNGVSNSVIEEMLNDFEILDNDKE